MEDKNTKKPTNDEIRVEGHNFDSPESLEGYIKTISPASFLLVFLILLFFVAFLLFGKTVSFEGELELPAVCTDGYMHVYFGEGDYHRVSECDVVLINGHEYYLPEAQEVTHEMDTNDYLYARSNENIYEGEDLYEFIFSADFPDGYYDASVILDKKRPLDEF